MSRSRPGKANSTTSPTQSNRCQSVCTACTILRRLHAPLRQLWFAAGQDAVQSCICQDKKQDLKIPNQYKRNHVFWARHIRPRCSYPYRPSTAGRRSLADLHMASLPVERHYRFIHRSKIEGCRHGLRYHGGNLAYRSSSRFGQSRV